MLIASACGVGEPEAVPEASGEPFFADVTSAAGLAFRHDNGAHGQFHFPEIMGAGVAFFDADNDGDLDVYLVQGRDLKAPAAEPADAGPEVEAGGRLWRNDLAAADGARRLRFTDVTTESGLTAHGYGMGVAAGDYDNDGHTDLYLTNFGPNQLWRNRGDGTWEDVTQEAGADDHRWSTSATFFDADRDGWLDLYIVNYVDYRLGEPRQCRSESGRRDYCGPQNFRPRADRLLRNRGSGIGPPSFEDVSGPAGILAEPGSGLGVAAADFDGDGWIDLYVANDLMPNVLWRNQGLGADGAVTFANQALIAGAAVNLQGAAEAGMGVAAGDLDGDGDDDLFLTHLSGETHTLYLNDGRGLFEDRTIPARLALPSLPATGFGTAMLDFDNDGWLDLVAVNGAVHLIEAQARAGDPFPFRQPDQIFRNLRSTAGRTVFEEVTDRAGGAFTGDGVSRGLAVGDVDNDGDPDLLIADNGGPIRLLRNRVGQDAHWLGLRLVGEEGRDQLGAVVEVEVGGHVRRRRVRADGSYCSANDPRVLLGLGDAAAAGRLRVGWPDGREELFDPVAIDRYTTLIQGTGRPPEHASAEAR